MLEVRGAPRHLRSDTEGDQGGSPKPDFIAHALRRWLAESGVGALYIEPGAPWENGYNESFHSRFRDELPKGELFTSLKEAKVVTEDFRLEYNHRRPHSSLGYRTPAEFAAQCRTGYVALRHGSAPPAR